MCCAQHISPHPHMTAQAPTLLLIDDAAMADAMRAAGWLVTLAKDVTAAHQYNAVLWPARSHEALAALTQHNGLAQAAFDSALVVLTEHADSALEADLLNLGVQAIVLTADGATLPRQLQHAVQRKQVERAARTAYATDLATGLPHQAQLLEHMTQLLALREREPAPMVLMVLRVEGFANASERLGGESANILRRKVAVRLRGGLRASDVVAALGNDTFGVLLGRLMSRGDGQRVAAKLAQALQAPFTVAGQPCAVSATVGLALYPEHGKDARSLMQRAMAQASSVATLGQDGQQGLAGRIERPSVAAANDDESA
jgi:diguanylate cyclase (GGDEF)-like protein